MGMMSDFSKIVYGVLGMKSFLVGGTNGAMIGNSGDKLKTKSEITDGTNSAHINSTGDINVNDGLRAGGVQGNILLSSPNVAVEVKVGPSRLTNRKCLTVLPKDADMYWGYSNSVTTLTGSPIFKNQFMTFDLVDSDTQIWLVCGENNKNARITEAP